MICTQCRGVVLSPREQGQRTYRRKTTTTTTVYTKQNICECCHRRELETGAEEAHDGAETKGR